MQDIKVEGRFKKASRNIVFSLLSQVVIILFELVARRFFLQVFSSEYLGLSSLFSSILNILSFAELGIGTAIIFSLYKPIAENDQDKICALMRVYKLTYYLIGTIILVTGSLVTPFLHLFVKEMPNLPYIHIIYLMYVFQSGSQYFFSYKISFLNANQQSYIFQRTQIVFSIIKFIFQLITILIFKNYFLYLGVTILCSLLLHAVCSIYVTKKYPFLKNKGSKLDRVFYKELKKNVFALLLYRIGNTLLVTIDTVIISKMLGVVPAAIYANYHMIITYSETFFTSVLGSVTPSIGNFMVKEKLERRREFFIKLQNVYSWISTIVGVGMIVCFNPLISTWLGNEFLLSQDIVLALVLSLTITNFQRPCSLVRDASGLFWHGKLRPLIMAIINITVSVLLTYYFGMIGVVIGTIVAKVLTFVWYDPYIVYKFVLKTNLKEYFSNYIEKWIIFIVLAVTCYSISLKVPYDGIIGLIINVINVLIIVNLAYLFILKKGGEYKYIKNQILRILSKKV